MLKFFDGDREGECFLNYSGTLASSVFIRVRIWHLWQVKEFQEETTWLRHCLNSILAKKKNRTDFETHTLCCTAVNTTPIIFTIRNSIWKVSTKWCIIHLPISEHTAGTANLNIRLLDNSVFFLLVYCQEHYVYIC